LEWARVRLGRQALTEIIEEQTAKRSRPIWNGSGPTMLADRWNATVIGGIC
jgi:hypothetical protein